MRFWEGCSIWRIGAAMRMTATTNRDESSNSAALRLPHLLYLLSTLSRLLLYSPLANRHECGTRICREKGIEYARRLLGHTNISTTQRYMHLDDQELRSCRSPVWHRNGHRIPSPHIAAELRQRRASSCTSDRAERSLKPIRSGWTVAPGGLSRHQAIGQNASRNVPTINN
jgi:hypothetical protein